MFFFNFWYFVQNIETTQLGKRVQKPRKTGPGPFLQEKKPYCHFKTWSAVLVIITSFRAKLKRAWQFSEGGKRAFIYRMRSIVVTNLELISQTETIKNHAGDILFFYCIQFLICYYKKNIRFKTKKENNTIIIIINV